MAINSVYTLKTLPLNTKCQGHESSTARAVVWYVHSQVTWRLHALYAAETMIYKKSDVCLKLCFSPWSWWPLVLQVTDIICVRIPDWNQQHHWHWTETGHCSQVCKGRLTSETCGHWGPAHVSIWWSSGCMNAFNELISAGEWPQAP